jgi:two-component system cell cycle sensor histidine kinase PleC
LLAAGSLGVLGCALLAVAGGPAWSLALACALATGLALAGWQRVLRLRRRLERTRRQLAAEIELRRRAEAASSAKSDFLARMSHDLRTPLHGIIGFAEIIRDQMMGPLENAKYLEYAGDIHRSGTHLLRLINDVLDLAKIEAGRFELAEDCFSPAAVILESVQSVRPLAEQGEIRLEIESETALPGLRADERTVRQMVLNLLSNAIKFTPAGGRVTIGARRGETGLALTVGDTGTGIDPKDLDAVLTEFGQAGGPRSHPAEGTGLGLAIVKSLIELHGGSLDLRSAPGIGTAVTLIFPPERLVAAREPPPGAGAGTPRPATGDRAPH